MLQFRCLKVVPRSRTPACLAERFALEFIALFDSMTAWSTIMSKLEKARGPCELQKTFTYFTWLVIVAGSK